MSPSCILFKPIHQLLNLHSLFIVAVEKWGVEKEGKWDEAEDEMKERPGKTEHTRIKNFILYTRKLSLWEKHDLPKWLFPGLLPWASPLYHKFCSKYVFNTQTKKILSCIQRWQMIFRMKGSLVEIKRKSWFKNPASHLEQWLTLILQAACFPLIFLIRSVLLNCIRVMMNSVAGSQLPKAQIITVLLSTGDEYIYMLQF